MCSAGTKFASLLALLLAAGLLLPCAHNLMAQTTVGTGSIVGTVSDPSGAVISGAKVTIKNAATALRINVETNSSGSFDSSALVPGNYKTQVSAKGFSSAETAVSVLVGNIATVNITLQVGGENQVIEVQNSTLQVNTQQPAVQGVLNEQQL